MMALRFDRTGDLDALRLAEVDAPEPAAGHVRVRIAAAGLNPSDVKNVLGRFPYTTLPRTPGRDFAGVVDRGPAGRVGLEVWGTGNELGFTHDGSHAEYLTLAVAALASFGRIALIAAPAEGHARVPTLALYRRGGSIIGINSILYDARACAPRLEELGRAFDAGALRPPAPPSVVPFASAVDAYRDVDGGRSDKVVFAMNGDAA
jgi:NADPH2:quinone reductase